MHRYQMLVHIQNISLDEEVCGLVASQKGVSQAIFPITNIYHSPTRFQMNAEEQLRAFIFIEKQGWELGAIYHSHPYGTAYPSETDLAEAFYPEAIQLIWYQDAGQWVCCAFSIQGNTYQDAIIIWDEV